MGSFYRGKLNYHRLTCRELVNEFDDDITENQRELSDRSHKEVVVLTTQDFGFMNKHSN